MFNGKDLTGWHNVNCAPGTFFVKDNMIITTGKPTGYLRTDKQYENFIAEFDWFHAPPKIRDKEVTRRSGNLDIHEINYGNSGFFVWCDPIPVLVPEKKINSGGYSRGIEVQILVGLRSTVAKTGETAYTSQGDLFSIHGAKCKPDRPHPLGWERCLPSENRTKGEYEWNHHRVVGNNGVLKLEVNGNEVSGVSECNPAQRLFGPRVGRFGVPVQEHQDQGIADHESEAGRNLRCGQGLEVPVHGAGFERLESRRQAKGPLENERRRPELRRQSQG